MTPAMMRPQIVAPLSRTLAVSDRGRSEAFYRDVLGFAVRGNGELVSGPAKIQLVAGDRAPDSTGQSRPRGAAILFLQVADVAAARDVVAGRGGAPSPASCEFYVRDTDSLHTELSGKGAKVQGPPVSQPWGLRTFRVRDLDGNELIFAQPFE